MGIVMILVWGKFILILVLINFFGKNVIDIYFDLERLSKKCPLMIEQGYPKKCRKAECMWWIEENCAVVIFSKQISNRRATDIIQKF